MYLDNETDSLLELLKSKKELESISFIKACPYAKKQTKICKKIAAISPGELDLESISVDDENFFGRYAIDIDLFVPYEFGSPIVYDDMEKIVRAIMSKSVCGIRLSSIVKASSAECYKMKATFTFSLAYSKEA